MRRRRQIQRKVTESIMSAMMVMSIPHKVMNVPGLGWWQGYNVLLGPLNTDRCSIRS